MQLRRILYSWDVKDYKYKIVESLTPKDDVAELDEYIFLVRKRLGKLLAPLKEITVTDLMIEDKKITEPMVFIDVNLEHLREVLKVVLKDVTGINLKEDKLSIRHILRHNLRNSLTRSRSSRICYSTSSMN